MSNQRTRPHASRGVALAPLGALSFLASCAAVPDYTTATAPTASSPVLVGRVARVGGPPERPPRAELRSRAREINAKVKHSILASSSTTNHGNYSITTTTVHATTVGARAIDAQVADEPTWATKVRASAFFHSGAFGWARAAVRVRGFADANLVRGGGHED